MSLERCESFGVPAETVRVARRMMRRPSMAMRLRDALGPVWSDADFVEAFPSRGRPAASPGALCLVSVLQQVENLTDRGAAEAVCARIDWRYALGLELDDPGFDASVLSEFRDRLVEHDLADRVLGRVLEAADRVGLLDKRSSVRTDSTKVLAKIAQLNRLELVAQTLRAALEASAVAAPEWLAGWMSEERYERYERPVDNWRLPKSHVERERFAAVVGADGFAFLSAVGRAGGPVAALAPVVVLRQVWAQQFVSDGDRVRLRAKKAAGPGAEVIESPFDPQARYGVKGDRTWKGYKVHLCETCSDVAPHLVVAVMTTSATEPDVNCTDTIAAQVRARGIRPPAHFVDQGYTSAAHIVAAAAEGTDLYGPVRGDHSANDGDGIKRFRAADFTIDPTARTVVCPAGQVSTSWREQTKRSDRACARVTFPIRVCRDCPLRQRCTSVNLDTSLRGRSLEFMIGPQGHALRKRRAEQESEAWKTGYRKRAGVEGTIAQATGRIGMRRCKYRGEAKTRLQHLLGAAAMNLIRIDAWQHNKRPETTRTTHLARLHQQHPA